MTSERMASFKVVFRQSISKDLQRIPTRDIARILSRIEALASEPRPRGAEKLSGQQRYRIRQGTYRILYEVREVESLVVVVKIGHRRDVYRSG